MTNIPTREDLDRDAQRDCNLYHYLSDRYPERCRGVGGVEENGKEEPNDSTAGREP